ncbi:MAG TPA: FkbM family methyltransferase [Hyphomicrobiaceae bacterium]|nr:FkbM family methyltransferase [Hyphomicrobiaceae bacterium]
MLGNLQGRVRRLRRVFAERLAETVVAALARNRRVRKNLVRSLFDRHLDPSCRVAVAFADHRFLVDPKDTQIGYKLMSGRAWQRTELEHAVAWLQQDGRLRSGGVFLDIGANIGTQTVYALLGGTFSRAVAIEADPTNYALLESNVEINGLTGRVALVRCAASRVPGVARLCLNRSNAGGHRIGSEKQRRPAPAIEVPADTIDRILRRVAIAPADVTLAWIDVEGHELAVLEGMAELLAACPPLVLEYAGSLHGPDGPARLRQLLAGRYRRVVDLGSGDAVAVPLADYDPGRAFRDLLIW